MAGITTVREIQNNPIDIRATGRLNKLYLELLKENPEWESQERRHDLNQFMARLIFCLFAEDTGIFYGEQTFTATVTQMSDSNDNTHEVIAELFRAMDTKPEDRADANIKPWADRLSLCEWRPVRWHEGSAAFQPHGAGLSAAGGKPGLEADQP